MSSKPNYLLDSRNLSYFKSPKAEGSRNDFFKSPMQDGSGTLKYEMNPNRSISTVVSPSNIKTSATAKDDKIFKLAA